VCRIACGRAAAGYGEGVRSGPAYIVSGLVVCSVFVCLAVACRDHGTDGTASELRGSVVNCDAERST
jgi:hypothetical protein